MSPPFHVVYLCLSLPWHFAPCCFRACPVREFQCLLCCIRMHLPFLFIACSCHALSCLACASDFAFCLALRCPVLDCPLMVRSLIVLALGLPLSVDCLDFRVPPLRIASVMSFVDCMPLCMSSQCSCHVPCLALPCPPLRSPAYSVSLDSPAFHGIAIETP